MVGGGSTVCEVCGLVGRHDLTCAEGAEERAGGDPHNGQFLAWCLTNSERLLAEMETENAQ